jgi:hypothetical protein
MNTFNLNSNFVLRLLPLQPPLPSAFLSFLTPSRASLPSSQSLNYYKLQASGVCSYYAGLKSFLMKHEPLSEHIL